MRIRKLPVVLVAFAVAVFALGAVANKTDPVSVDKEFVTEVLCLAASGNYHTLSFDFATSTLRVQCTLSLPASADAAAKAKTTGAIKGKAAAAATPALALLRKYVTPDAKVVYVGF